MRTGFERFEKSGAGILPVILLSGLMILGTIGVVEFASQSLNESPRLMSTLIDVGAILGKSLGYAERYEPVVEGTECFDKTQKELPEISPSLPAPAYSYAGAFQITLLNKGCIHVYLNEAQDVLVEVVDLERRPVTESSRYLVCFVSVTDDQRLIQTCNSRTPSFTRPWIDEESIETGESLTDIVSGLAEAHARRTASLVLQTIPPETLLDRSREEAERTALWLMDQAPVPVSMIMDYIRRIGLPENQRLAALLLMGFSRESSKGYDRAAIDAYLSQLRSEGKDSGPSDKLVVLHAMTNELHLCDQFPDAISKEELNRRLAREWLPQIVSEGKADPKRIELLLGELTRDNPLEELGAIERPFPAKIYQKR